MKIKNISLAWIATGNIIQAKKFFTETLELKVSNDLQEHGWLELHAKNDDFLLGVGQVSKAGISQFATTSDIKPIVPGQNAIISFEVPDIEAAKKELEAKNVRVYDIVTIADQIKMAFMQDLDGNFFQLVELLD